ncbi:MAG: 4Fe-4S dicluster domain-containing protein [Anaerolineae bacterium]|nr:MAG: 4Fe-4S dicluster domain-containing protein [Anaerolineae bacterium]
MLSPIERIIFLIAAVAAAGAAGFVALRIARTIGRGQGKPDWSIIPGRLVDVAVKFVGLTPTWKTRPLASLFHALVAWGFTLYLLVNLGDVLEGYLPEFHMLGAGPLGNFYRLLADVLSVGVLIGMTLLLVRRFVRRDPALNTRATTLLHPKAAFGKMRDSLIVGVFILVHIGFRFLGKSFEVVLEPDAFQPFASLLGGLWAGWSPAALETGVHVGFWVALGVIMAFMPYFLISKHVHLFMAPINYLLRPRFKSPGALTPINFEDESISQFGATRIEDLPWHSILDAYACIMCNRCQDACPAYTTGKVLSPAALEINKRYFLNEESGRLARGEASSKTLLEFAITQEAVMACTACGACTEICPVGNDPMRDILEVRRSLVLMENKFPEQWQTAFRGMERASNPWGVPATERLKWAEGLDVKTIDQNPEPDILWWVGCAASTDARAQKTARAFAAILNKAGVNYAVLGQHETCTGDSARRAGNEYLFFEMAKANVELLNEVKPKRIVAACPHCLHTLLNEYPAFGGNYEVVHHTQLINELIQSGKLTLEEGSSESLTFHDPCYLGRQNSILIDPRQVLESTGANLVEMQKHGSGSFCCGAGGAQMWKEEEHGTEGVNANRYAQAQATGAGTLAVGCPFCMVMMNDANKAAGEGMVVKDVAEIVAERMK